MFKKLFFYLIVVPLSWTNADWAIDLYRRVHDLIWPEKSMEYQVLREEVIHKAQMKMRTLRSQGDRIYAFRGFRYDEILVADNPDPIERWKEAKYWVERLDP